MATTQTTITLTTSVKEVFPGGKVATTTTGSLSATGTGSVSNVYAIIYCGDNLSSAPVIAQGYLTNYGISYSGATVGKKIFVQAALLNGPTSGTYTMVLQY
jgi:hypothetical protein